MTTRIQLRRATAAAWTSINPVLAVGEPAVESDTGKLKVGDGTAAWSSLPYILDVADLTPVIEGLVAAAIVPGLSDENVRDIVGTIVVGDGDFITVDADDVDNVVRVLPGAALSDALVEVQGRLSDESLRAAFGAPPAHAGSTQNRYDPAKSIYNLKSSNIRRARAALAAARAGAGLCRITFVGDSLTAGYTDTRGTSDPVTYFRAEMTRRGYPTGELIHTVSNIPEPRIVQSAGWSTNGDSFAFLVGNQGATLTVTGTGTALEIVAGGYGATWSYAIDGGASNFVPAPATDGPLVTTVPDLTDGEHTVVITQLDPGNSYIHSIGFRPDTGVVVENAGISGSTTNEWINNGDNWSPATTLFNAKFFRHDIVCLELGANDWTDNVAIPAYKANLTTLIGQARGFGATVLLVASQPPEGAETTFLPYLSAAYDVADASDVPLLDLADRLGFYAERNADGFAYDVGSDSTHLTPVGNAAKARAWLDLLH